MSLLKAPPQQRKNVTLQVRIDEDLRGRLVEYTDFLGSSESYVVSEALRLIFEKDREFKEWRNERSVVARERDESAPPPQTDEIAPQSLRTDRGFPNPASGSTLASASSTVRTGPQALSLDCHKS